MLRLHYFDYNIFQNFLKNGNYKQIYRLRNFNNIRNISSYSYQSYLKMIENNKKLKDNSNLSDKKLIQYDLKFIENNQIKFSSSKCNATNGNSNTVINNNCARDKTNQENVKDKVKVDICKHCTLTPKNNNVSESFPKTKNYSKLQEANSGEFAYCSSYKNKFKKVDNSNNKNNNNNKTDPINNNINSKISKNDDCNLCYDNNMAPENSSKNNCIESCKKIQSTQNNIKQNIKNKTEIDICKHCTLPPKYNNNNNNNNNNNTSENSQKNKDNSKLQEDKSGEYAHCSSYKNKFKKIDNPKNINNNNNKITKEDSCVKKCCLTTPKQSQRQNVNNEHKTGCPAKIFRQPTKLRSKSECRIASLPQKPPAPPAPPQFVPVNRSQSNPFIPSKFNKKNERDCLPPWPPKNLQSTFFNRTNNTCSKPESRDPVRPSTVPSQCGNVTPKISPKASQCVLHSPKCDMNNKNPSARQESSKCIPPTASSPPTPSCKIINSKRDYKSDDRLPPEQMKPKKSSNTIIPPNDNFKNINQNKKNAVSMPPVTPSPPPPPPPSCQIILPKCNYKSDDRSPPEQMDPKLPSNTIIPPNNNLKNINQNQKNTVSMPSAPPPPPSCQIILPKCNYKYGSENISQSRSPPIDLNRFDRCKNIQMEIQKPRQPLPPPPPHPSCQMFRSNSSNYNENNLALKNVQKPPQMAIRSSPCQPATCSMPLKQSQPVDKIVQQKPLSFQPIHSKCNSKSSKIVVSKENLQQSIPPPLPSVLKFTSRIIQPKFHYNENDRNSFKSSTPPARSSCTQSSMPPPLPKPNCSTIKCEPRKINSCQNIAATRSPTTPHAVLRKTPPPHPAVRKPLPPHSSLRKPSPPHPSLQIPSSPHTSLQKPPPPHPALRKPPPPHPALRKPPPHPSLRKPPSVPIQKLKFNLPQPRKHNSRHISVQSSSLRQNDIRSSKRKLLLNQYRKRHRSLPIQRITNSYDGRQKPLLLLTPPPPPLLQPQITSLKPMPQRQQSPNNYPPNNILHSNRTKQLRSRSFVRNLKSPFRNNKMKHVNRKYLVINKFIPKFLPASSSTKRLLTTVHERNKSFPILYIHSNLYRQQIPVRPTIIKAIIRITRLSPDKQQKLRHNPQVKNDSTNTNVGKETKTKARKQLTKCGKICKNVIKHFDKHKE